MSAPLVEPKQLRKVRVQLGITQAELARAADVSQSLIAKVESGQVDPSFGAMKSISEALRRRIRSHGRKASDVMSAPLISVQPSTPLSECINLMRKKAVSQLPVLSGGKVVGSISENRIVSLLAGSDDPRKVLESQVGRHMEEGFPIVAPDTPIDALFSLFQFMPAVLVGSGERIDGIVAKIDMLSAEAR